MTNIKGFIDNIVDTAENSPEFITKRACMRSRNWEFIVNSSQTELLACKAAGALSSETFLVCI